MEFQTHPPCGGTGGVGFRGGGGSPFRAPMQILRGRQGVSQHLSSRGQFRSSPQLAFEINDTKYSRIKNKHSEVFLIFH